MTIKLDGVNNRIDGGSGGIFGDISTGSANIRSFNYIQPSAEYSAAGNASSYTLSNPDLIIHSGFNFSARFLPASPGLTNGLNFRALDASSNPRRLYYQQTYKMTASGNTNTVVEYWNDTGAAGVVDLCGGTYGVGTSAPSHRGLQMHMVGGALDFSSLVMAPSLYVNCLWPVTGGIIASCLTRITNSNNTSTGYDWDKFNFYFDSGNMSYMAHGFT